MERTKEDYDITLDKLGVLREEVMGRLEALGSGVVVRAFVDVAYSSFFVFNISKLVANCTHNLVFYGLR